MINIGKKSYHTGLFLFCCVIFFLFFLWFLSLLNRTNQYLNANSVQSNWWGAFLDRIEGKDVKLEKIELLEPLPLLEIPEIPEVGGSKESSNPQKNEIKIENEIKITNPILVEAEKEKEKIKLQPYFEKEEEKEKEKEEITTLDSIYETIREALDPYKSYILTPQRTIIPDLPKNIEILNIADETKIVLKRAYESVETFVSNPKTKNVIIRAGGATLGAAATLGTVALVAELLPIALSIIPF